MYGNEDEFPWQIEEKAAIRKAVNELNMPFLGICLGHQLLADALGGKVSRCSSFEIGAFTIEATEQGNKHPFMSGLCQDIPWINIHIAEVTGRLTLRLYWRGVHFAPIMPCQLAAMRIRSSFTLRSVKTRLPAGWRFLVLSRLCVTCWVKKGSVDLSLRLKHTSKPQLVPPGTCLTTGCHWFSVLNLRPTV